MYYKELATEIKVYGTEIAFMKAVINHILSASTRFSCDEDPDDEYDSTEKGSDYVPSFIIKIDGRPLIKLVRGANLSTGCLHFTGYVYTSSSELTSGSGEINFKVTNAQSIAGVSDVLYRHFFTNILINDNIVNLCFMGGGDNGGYRVSNVWVTEFASSNKVYRSNVINNSYWNTPYDKYLVVTNDGTTKRTFKDYASEVTGIFASRFSFASQPGKIDYIKSSVCVSGSNKVFDITSVYDCTGITIGSTVSLKDGAYLAVGPNSLIKVS